MNEALQRLIEREQAVYPAIKAKVDGQAQQIADLSQANASLQGQVQQYQAGLPADAVTPTQLADLEAVVSSLEALAS